MVNKLKRSADILKIFSNFLEMYSGIKEVDFLDVNFSQNNGIYTSYRKGNNILTYKNIDSNHPPVVIKHPPSILPIDSSSVK